MQKEKIKDVIFVTAVQAQADAKENGRENVVNGTLGAIHDEDGKLVFLKTVKDEYLSLPDSEYVGYARLQVPSEFLAAAEAECFGQSRPEGHIRSIATTPVAQAVFIT